VAVTIEDLTPEVESAGLLMQQLQTDVELRLRLAGIRVLTREEGLRVVGKPVLAIHVNVLLNQLLGLTVYNILVGLYQSVSLETGAVSERASTWSTGTTGILAMNDLSRIREKVRDQVDQFINAYLSVNPRPTGGPAPSSNTPSQAPRP